jgi:hypothetical protein
VTTRLYHVALSPFCRKVRLTLAEKRIEVELIEERYWERGADFLRRNPAGKVPVCATTAACCRKARRSANTSTRRCRSRP